jgi:hypothetical protein
MGSISDRFVNHAEHRDKSGEPECNPPEVPKLILDLLEIIPHEEVSAACDIMGHPSFWLGPGYRYFCVCGEFAYHD